MTTDAHYLTYAGALALPMLAVYFVLFNRLVTSASKDQIQILLRPKWMALLNVLVIAIVLVIFSRLDSRLYRLLGVAGFGAAMGIMTIIRNRQMREMGVSPTLLAKLNRLTMLGGLALSLLLIAFVLDGT